MPLVYVVRHPEYDTSYTELPGRLPVPLSKKGEKQAKQLATFFEEKNISRIYSSAVRRCQETVKIISQDKVPVRYDVRLGDALSAYQGYWDKNYEGDENHFFKHVKELGGETLENVQERMVDFFEEVTRELQHNIIICTHSDPIITLHCHIAEMELPIAHKQRGLELKLDYGSIQPIKVTNDEMSLLPVIKVDDIDEKP